MDWDSDRKPRIRPLEALSIPGQGGGQLGVRDQSGLSDVLLTVSEPALALMELLDGSRTFEQIRDDFRAAFGQAIAPETLRSMLDSLVDSHLLEGPEFEKYYEKLFADYRTSGVRKMPHASSYGVNDDSGDLFARMLGSETSPAANETVRGLIAPHLDYPRGEPCYATAYGTLRNSPKPDRVIILGTNHFGRAASVVTTANDFATPLGVTRADSAFIDRMERTCGDLRRYELDHLREHSIELQVLWLQYLFGPDSFEIVPFLCPDPCGPTGTAPYDGQGVDLLEFAESLGSLVSSSDGQTLIVAGADLSHVGVAFGDRRLLNDDYLAEVETSDRRALNALVDGGPNALVQCVAQDDNSTRVCSVGCIFVLAAALSDCTRRVLKYHQAVDRQSQTCVTCAAAVLT